MSIKHPREFGNTVSVITSSSSLPMEMEEEMDNHLTKDFWKAVEEHNIRVDHKFTITSGRPVPYKEPVVKETGERWTPPEDYDYYIGVRPEGIEMCWMGKWVHTRSWYYFEDAE